jgi:hypothetical protein
MAELATLAGFDPGLHLVTLPTVLVKDHFGTEAFVRDVPQLYIVAVVTGLGLEMRRTGRVVTGSAIDPEIVEVLFVRKVQRHRVGLVVALVALDLHLVGMLFVVEDEATHHRRGSLLYRWRSAPAYNLDGL